jgi:3-carboxy-cis,cis-muconate cycloisomerase
VRTQQGLFAGIFGRGGVDTGDEAWLQAMLDAEAALARAVERAGLAAAGAGAAVTAAAVASGFDPVELGRQAALTGSPVPPLVRALTAAVPPWAASSVHRGATSQDILDTAAMLVAKRALRAVLADLADAADAAAGLAAAHRDTIMIGRTLLQQAVPVTFGLVAAGWLASIDEARQALARVRDERLAVQLGGAAGTLAALGEAGPRVAALLAGELGLALPVLPWHTDRRRILDLAAALTGAAAALGKIARDVTLLAQSEVAEVREGGAGRGGSSAMPHKRNPVASVLVLGCTRRVPGLLATLAAAAEQEHQRAAGAWHAEWEPLADLLRLTGSAASWGAELLAGLVVDGRQMRANLDAAGGFPMAERVAALLAPALGPAAAHDLIAAASADAVAAGESLGGMLKSGDTARSLAAAGVTPGQIDAALDPAGYLGAAAELTDAALAAHRDLDGRLRS